MLNFQDALALAAPELFLAVSALVLLVLGAFRGDRSTALVSALSGLVLIGAAVMAAVGPHGAAFGGTYVADAAAAFAKVFIYGFSAVSVLLGDRWLAKLKAGRFEYPVLIVIAALGMGMMASSGDLISLYMGIELHSLALYVLAAFRRDDARSSEAGLKYFVLGALSSGILLYGASLIYGFAGSTHFTDIAASVQGGAEPAILFGLVFLMCGVAFKVSAAPFHMWTPDVYEGAPTPVVIFITTAPKLAALILLARILVDAFPGAADQWRQVLICLSLISVAVGAFAGLVQKNLKRLLAYSSIANIGYALIGLTAGDAQGVQSMLVFMVLYMVDVTGFFAVLMALQRDGKPMERLEDFAGLIKTRPGLALAVTALSFSVLGLPPFSGFWAKYFVFKAAVASGFAWVAVIGLVLSVVAAFYYLRVVKTMWFDAPPAGDTDPPSQSAKGVAYVAALFSFPVVLIALTALEPAALHAAQALFPR